MTDNVFWFFLGDAVRGGDAQRIEDFAQRIGHGRFTRSGITGKDEVEFGEAFCTLPQLNEPLLHGDFLRNTADGVLHGVHAHELVHLFHHVLHGQFLGGFLPYQVCVGEDIVLRVPEPMPFNGFVEQIPHVTGIAEGVRPLEIHALEHLGGHFVCLGVQGEVGLFVVVYQEHAEQLFQFLGVVVREFDGHVAAGRDARVHAHELRHLLGIAGHDAHKLPFAVLQQVQERIHGIHAKAAVFSAAALEGIGLVNEQYAAHGLVHVILHIGLRVSHILADEILAGNFHELPRGQRTNGVEHLSELAGEGGFAGAGIAGKEVVVLQELFLQPLLLLFLDVAHNGADLVLHALQADIPVQLRENFFFALGNEAFIGVDILFLNDFAATGGRIYEEPLRHHFRQVPVAVAHLLLAHEPGKMGR